jgi:hypothetical protein
MKARVAEQVCRDTNGLWLLAALSVIAFLLLPVNYGILITNRDFARVRTLDGEEAVKAGVTGWRVWEAKRR